MSVDLTIIVPGVSFRVGNVAYIGSGTRIKILRAIVGYQLADDPGPLGIAAQTIPEDWGVEICDSSKKVPKVVHESATGHPIFRTTAGDFVDINLSSLPGYTPGPEMKASLAYLRELPPETIVLLYLS